MILYKIMNKPLMLEVYLPKAKKCPQNLYKMLTIEVAF